VDIVIFFPNKIILSNFWLQIWWDDVKHRNTPFQQVWGGGSTDWQISCLNLKIAPNPMFLPPWHP